MAEIRWQWRALLVALLLAVAAFVPPVMALDESPTTSPLNETLTWTLPPTPDKVAEGTPEETAEEDQNETPKETESETLEETPVTTEGETSGDVPNETMVQIAPGDTLQVTEEVQVYDLSALRNETASGATTAALPVIELQAYEDDNPRNGELIGTVRLGASDTDVKLDASDFNGIYGTYYPYDGEGVIDKPITVEGPSGANETVNATETSTSDVKTEDTATTSDTTASDEKINETAMETEPPATTGQDEVMTEATPAEMPTFTPMLAVEVETSPTQAAPAPFLSVIVALTVAGLVIMMRRR